MGIFEEYKKQYDDKYRFAFYSPKLDEIALVDSYMIGEGGGGKRRICFRNRDTGKWESPFWEKRMREDIFNLTYPVYLGDLDAQHIELKELDHLK